jgi:phosphoglycerate dehydrogenase-like enzyme
LKVCVGFPPLHEEKYLARLRTLSGVEPVILPIDPDGEWATISPGEPFPEPPPWAQSVARERERALAESEVLVALHAPDRLSELAPKLRWVQGAGAGVEQFGLCGLDRERVVLTNCSGLGAPSMAEWVIGRLLQVWKRFREIEEYQREHAFTRAYGRTFAGSTIGIVGLGAIGAAVGVRARALGCRVLGLKRSARPGDRSDAADVLYPPEGLHELLGQSDAVVIAAPSTPETRHLIDARALAAMPRSAVLVNVARGALVDEVELARVMREEPLAAAILDVFDPEPLAPESPLWDLPNVYVSAHSSVSVDRYMDDVFDLFFENLERYLADEPLLNQVDMDQLGFA